MNASECGLMLGYAFIIVLIFYAVLKALAPITTEPLANQSDMSAQQRLEAYKAIGEKRSNSLNIASNRAVYQDILAQLEDNINLAMLQKIQEGGSDLPSEQKMATIIQQQEYKRTLKALDNFLDYHKAS